MSAENKLKLTEAEWHELGTKLYGDDRRQWKFKCPSCEHVAKVQDWIDAGGEEANGMVAFSCVGRLTGSTQTIGSTGKGPCNYAGGGLFRFNPVEVTFPDGNTSHFFAFADELETNNER